MTDDPELHSDIYGDRPNEQARSIVARLIATFQEHSPGPRPTRSTAANAARTVTSTTTSRA